MQYVVKFPILLIVIDALFVSIANGFIYGVGLSAGDRCDYLDDLQCELLRTYDRHRYDDKKVAVKLSINHLDMDEINSILTLYGMIQMQWQDDQLRWDPANHTGDTDTVVFRCNEIWQPDIRALEYASFYEAMQPYTDGSVRVRHTGQATWTTTVQFEVFCQLHVRPWPWDRHQCRLFLSSWYNRGYEIVAAGSITDAFLEPPVLDAKNTEWKVVDWSGRQQTSPFIGPCLLYRISLQRQSAILTLIVTLAIFLATALTLLPLHMSVSRMIRERLQVQCLSMVVAAMWLIIFVDYFATMTVETPLIVIFFTRTILANAGSMMVTIVAYNLVKVPESLAATIVVPKWIQIALSDETMVFGKWGNLFAIYAKRIVCYRKPDERSILNGDNDDDDDDEHDDCTTRVEQKSSIEWIHVIKVADRLLVFCILVSYFELFAELIYYFTFQ